MVEKLLCPDRFFAFRSKIEPSWVTAVAKAKTIIAKMYPHLLTVNGRPNMPDPMTVLMMVVTLSKKSAFFIGYLPCCRPQPRCTRFGRHFSPRWVSWGAGRSLLRSLWRRIIGGFMRRRLAWSCLKRSTWFVLDDYIEFISCWWKWDYDGFDINDSKKYWKFSRISCFCCEYNSTNGVYLVLILLIFY